METVNQYIKDNFQGYVDDLCAWLKIPSVSAQSEHNQDCVHAAQFILERLQGMGFDSHIYETPGKPIVLAKYAVSDDKPTVLIYGHYDVQPVDPLDKWNHDPFEPYIENDKVYARGATDNKGQIMAHINAVDAYLRVHNTLPVNVIFLIEGEEEIASNNLEDFIAEHKEELKSDIAVVSDSSQFGENVPAICYGLRGICVEEIRVDGANTDLHSGVFGGSIPNPAEMVSRLIARMKDDDGRILIPGFYDDVVPLEDWERKAFAELPWSDDHFQASLSVQGLHGEKGYTTLERRWARPTLEVNGIFGGYSDEGSKTVIPAWAGAKFSMRLVPNQSPQKISELFRNYVESILPDYAHLTFFENSNVGAGPVVVPRDAAFMKEAHQAISKGFGIEPVYIREGGSIPIILSFKEILGLDTLLLGFGLPDDRAHAPNEKFSLIDYKRGTQSSAWFLHLASLA